MHVVIGITGGIAAYKAAGLIRLFTEAGHSVKVIPTQNALKFIGATTLEALSHNIVDSDLYTDVDQVKHIQLGKEADLIVVAPATANFLAKTASGIADDLLGNTILASTAPILLAPAMHTEMWLNLANQANLSTLRERGFNIIDPAEGRLTGEDTGIGRLPEVEQIFNAALTLIKPKDFAGKHVVVTAGGTREAIDPVRFIGNRSSGKQGTAIALSAALRGARVTLIGANMPTVSVSNVHFVAVNSAAELEHQVNTFVANADILVQAAAVSDYRVKEPSAFKLKRSILGDEIALELVANPDILAGAISRIRNEGLNCQVVGFAAETAKTREQLYELAQAKLMSKGCDIIVANDVSDGKVFDSDNNHVLILTREGDSVEVSGNKTEVANSILDIIAK